MMPLLMFDQSELYDQYFLIAGIALPLIRERENVSDKNRFRCDPDPFILRCKATSETTNSCSIYPL